MRSTLFLVLVGLASVLASRAFVDSRSTLLLKTRGTEDAGTWKETFKTSFALQAADTANWKCNKGSEKASCTLFGCPSVATLLGGPDKANGFGRGTSAEISLTLPSHTKIRIQFDLVQFGPWIGSTFFAALDGNKVWQRNTAVSAEAGSPSVCNSGVREGITKVIVEVNHIASSSTLNLYGDISDSESFWGISNLIISSYTPPESPIGGTCGNGIRCLQGDVAVICIDSTCVQECVSSEDPRKAGMCLWQPGFVPLGRACAQNSHCTTKTCVDNRCADKCDAVHCQNGFDCKDGRCVCGDGFTGTYCQVPPDPCKDIVCNNKGECIRGQCSCVNGYTGTRCEVLPVAPPNPQISELEKTDMVVFHRMSEQNARLEQRLAELTTTMETIRQGILKSQDPLNAYGKTIDLQLQNDAATFHHQMGMLRQKITLLKTSLEALKKAQVDEAAAAAREEMLTREVHEKAALAAQLNSMKQAATASMQQNTTNTPPPSSSGVIPPPPPPPSAYQPTYGEKSLVINAKAEQSSIVKGESADPLSGIDLSGVPAVTRSSLSRAVDVMTTEEKRMNDLHGLTTDIELRD